MALVIQTNNAAVTAQKNINTNVLGQNKALNRLSSGFRINSAADDAAGFAISSKLDAQGSRLKAAVQNASQATALVKTAEAGVNEIQNMIVRLQSLAIQASSANNAGQLTQLDAERTKLTSAINNIANSTNFNGTNLLNGVDANGAATAGTAATGKAITAGGGITVVASTANIFDNATFTIKTTAGTAATTGTIASAGTIVNGTSVTMAVTGNAKFTGATTFAFTMGTQGNIVSITTSSALLSQTDGSTIAAAGASVYSGGTAKASGLITALGLTFTNSNAATTSVGTTGTSVAFTAGTDYVAGTVGTVTSVKSSVALTDVNGKVTSTAGTELLAATVNRPAAAGALVLTLKNTGGTGTAGSITLTDVALGSQTATPAASTLTVTTTLATAGTQHADYTGALSFQVGAENNASNRVDVKLQNKYTTAGLAITGDISTAANAQTYIDTLNTSLGTLISQRADLGATANQLGFVTSNLATSIEQVSASVSSIRDANIATEIANFTKSQILVQAGTAMLAQANQASKNVLRLFQ